MRNWIVLLVSLLAHASTTRADEIIINMIANASEQSALSGTCKYGKTDAVLTCRTVQVSVSYASDSKDSDKARRGIDVEIAESFKTDADVEAFCKKQIGNQQSIVYALDHLNDTQKANLDVAGPIAIEQGKAVIAMCQHPTLEAYQAFARTIVSQEERQCLVQVALPQTEVFKKVSDAKWISTADPDNICHAINITSLERANKKSPLWTWTQVTSTADDSKLCRTLGVTQSINKPLVFSWRSGPFPMHCDTVSFGHGL
jgi:hypothetical protein